MKRVSFVLLLAALCAVLCASVSAAVWDGSVASGFASGSGSADNPYIIKTAEQLAYFAQKVNGGTNYSGKYIRLDADIVLNDLSDWQNWSKTTAPANIWTPIDGDGQLTVSDVLFSLSNLLNGRDGIDLDGDGNFSLIDILRLLKICAA